MYQNVETIEIDGRWHYPRFNEFILETLKTIKQVPAFKLKFMLDDNITSLVDIIDSINADRNDISVEHFINAVHAEEIIISSKTM